MAVMICSLMSFEKHPTHVDFTYRRNTIAPAGTLNTEPEHGENATTDDAKVAQPIPITSTSYNGKRDVQVSANAAVQNGGDGVANAGDQGDDNRIGSGEPGRHNRTRGLPARDGDEIRKPVRHEGPLGPGKLLERNGVLVRVGPDVWRGDAALLLGQLPTAWLRETEAYLLSMVAQPRSAALEDVAHIHADWMDRWLVNNLIEDILEARETRGGRR